jgi:hypothetical protein
MMALRNLTPTPVPSPQGRAITYPVREEHPHPCPLPARGRETLKPASVFWSPPLLRGRDRVGGTLPALAGVAVE